MPSGIMYRLLNSDGSSITYVQNHIEVVNNRDVLDQVIPFVADPWVTDMITTRKEIIIQGKVKTGTGWPYATIAVAEAAIEAMTPNSRSTGWQLRGGDWDGSNWNPNSGYPFTYGTQWPTVQTKVATATIRYSHTKGEGFTSSELPITITLKFGIIY